MLEGPGPAPRGPLVKGGWHGVAVTGGFPFLELFWVTESPRHFVALPPLTRGAFWVPEGPGPAPKGPLVKGGWHGVAVTGGFFSQGGIKRAPRIPEGLPPYNPARSKLSQENRGRPTPHFWPCNIGR